MKCGFCPFIFYHVNRFLHQNKNMKKLVSGIFYDTLKSEKILTVTGHLGERSLWVGRNGHFFTIEDNGNTLVPCTPDEALDFLDVNKSRMDARTHRNIIVKYFGKEPPKQKALVALPYGAVLVARGADPFPPELYYVQGQFWLKRDGSAPREVFESQALKFVEEIQKNLTLDQLEKILDNYFPNLKKS